MATLRVDIVNVEKVLFSGEAHFVVIPGQEGELGVYPAHAHLVTTVRMGCVRVYEAQKITEVVISGGIADITPHVVIVLADFAVRSEDIDEQHAQEAYSRALELLKHPCSTAERHATEVEIALVRIQIAALRRLHARS